ncbi:MAG: hypothetical protein NZP74_04715 [Anaerolineales bacterium]|nr:hypothetical protein [Anaerolineales bacterium]MDW8276696.1 hypothetical protein [Anaerolineales bacterium]
MPSKQTIPSPKVLFPWLATILFLHSGALGGVAVILAHVSRSSGRALAFGLSAPSLVLTGLTLLAALGLLVCGLLVRKGKPPAEMLLRALLHRPAWSLTVLTAVALASWLTVWTPPERFERLYYYALRLLPLAGWLALAAGSWALFTLAAWRGIDPASAQTYLHQNRAVWTVGALTLALIGGIAWLAAQRVVRMNPAEEDFWYGAGVPVLAWQVLVSLLAGAGMAWMEKKFFPPHQQSSSRVDALAFALIWAVSGLLWASAPLASNFMLSPPYPPNFAPYPAADSENYDLASQYALIGQGLFNHGQMKIYFERPLYSALLFYLHLLAGQDYAQLLGVQAFLCGVLPALAYLTGKELHSRALGTALAALLALRGWNGLALGGIIETATPKMLLTEFPTATGLALVIWLAIRWARAPQAHWPMAAWLGGVVGLWSFIRPHMLFFLLPSLALAFGVSLRKRWLGSGLAGLVFAAYLAAVLPWMQFNGSGISLVSLYIWRAQAIIQERFHWPLPGGSFRSEPVASLGVLPLPQAAPHSKSVLEFGRDHLLNNLTLAALSLPTTLQNFDLETLVRQTETFWIPYWDGQLSASARPLLPLNMILLCLGIGLAWRRAGVTGLFPLAGMLLYFLVNSLVRTSGGRYLVPADWILFLYYLLGLAALFAFAAAWFGLEQEVHPSHSEEPAPTLRRGAATLLLVAGLGALIPVTNLFYPPRYEPADKFQLANKLNAATLAQMDVPPETIQRFLQQTQAVLLEGRALYPRFIRRGVNPLIPGHLLEETRYSRMAFTVIGQHGHLPVVLVTGDSWFSLPHAADAMVLGCQKGEFVDAWAVILPESGAVHLRQPAAPLVCPLPEPVCDNNGVCR